MQQLLVEIDSSSQEDAGRIEELTLQLRGEIAELDVDAVEVPPGNPAPENAKAGPGFDWGKLLVTLAESGSVLGNVIKAVDNWIKNQGGRGVVIEIDGDRLELTGVTTDDQRALIQHWIDRHRE